MKGNVSYQLPRLCGVEWAVEIRGEKYRNIWEERPCCGGKHCPQGLAETATWRHWRMCGPVLWRNFSLAVLGEEQVYETQDKKERRIERSCSLINVGWNCNCIYYWSKSGETSGSERRPCREPVLIIAFIWNRNYYSLVKEITRIPGIIQSLMKLLFFCHTWLQRFRLIFSWLSLLRICVSH
jgi:hypothetical protein